MQQNTATQWPAQRQHQLFGRTNPSQLMKLWTSCCSGAAPEHHPRQQCRKLHKQLLRCIPAQSEGRSSISVSDTTYTAVSDRADSKIQSNQHSASRAALAAAEAIAAAAEAAFAVVDSETVTNTAAAWQAEVFSKAVLGNRTVGSSAVRTGLGQQRQLHRRERTQSAGGNTTSSANSTTVPISSIHQPTSTGLALPDSQVTHDSAASGGAQQPLVLSDLLGLKQAAAARVEAAAAADAAAVEVEQAWQDAVKAVSAAVGIPVAIVSHQTELLRLLLPDLDQTLAARKAASLQWEAVCHAVRLMQPAGGSLDWAKDELVIMDMVMTAIRSSERDGKDAFLHNLLMMSISNFFSAVRCCGPCDPDLRRQHRLLLSQLEQCIVAQQDCATQLMHQQVKLAATTEQLPEKLIGLKGCLPSANVSQLVIRHPQLLRHQPEQLKQMVAQAESLLCQLDSADVMFVLESEPWLLEEGALIGSIEGLRHLFPAKEPCTLLLQHVRTGGSKLLAEFKQQAFVMIGLETEQEGNR